jgi:protein TonB
MRTWFLVASMAVHAAAFGTLLFFGRQPREHHFQQVAVVKEKKKPKEEKPPEEKPAPPPPPRPALAAPPPPASAPVVAAPKASAPHFATGLTLGNGPSSGVGIAIGGATNGPVEHVEREVAPEHRENRPPPPKQDAPDLCDQPDTKPRPVGTNQVEYSDKARADGVEGRIQVVIHVNDDGSVASVEVVSGIEGSLDAYVLSIIRSWKFTPATHCGRPVAGTLTWAQRFELGD